MPRLAVSKRSAEMKTLNIWWLSQYASTPDQQFTAQYDLAKRLVEKGHRVTIFASGFSHYKFKEIRLKPHEKWRAEECEGVRFIWLRTSPYNANNWKRILNMCSYAWRAYRLARSWKEEEVDVIVGTTVHPLTSLAAYRLSVARQVPFVFDVGDLWPLTLVQFGMLSSRSPITIGLAALEKFLARRAARISTQLPGGPDYYSQMGIPKEKTCWIPNGLDLSRYENMKPYEGKLSAPFTLLYAGGHVEAFRLDTILGAAQILQANGSHARFVFVGGGQDKPRLLKIARDLELENVEFRDPVPKEELRRVLERADAFLLSMRDLPDLYRYGVSFNKLCDYVAAGRPVLFAGNPSNNFVEECHCGIAVPPENPKAFAAAIQRFENLTPGARAEMGRNALRCAKEKFDISMLADRLERMLVSVTDEWKGYRNGN
jgi:glycosyltransferase involved in cell wall biosynthesis